MFLKPGFAMVWAGKLGRSRRWCQVITRSLTTDGRDGDGGNSGGQKSGWRKVVSYFQKPDEEEKKRRDEKHEILMERMRRSVFYDAKQSSTEKLVIADDRILVGSESIDFPGVMLTSVASGQPVESKALFDKHVTLVTVSFQAHGKMQSDTWHAPFLSAFHLTSANPVKHVQVVDIVFLEGFLFAAVKGLMLKSTLNAVSPAMQSRTFIRFEASTPETEMFCHKLKIHNRLMGFAYLVDWTGKVRWRAQGTPSETEVPALITAATKLLKSVPGNNQKQK